MNTNTKLYMLVNLVRSYDKNHTSKGLIHLICSVFYTQNFSSSNLNKNFPPLGRKSVVLE